MQRRKLRAQLSRALLDRQRDLAATIAEQQMSILDKLEEKMSS